MGEPEDLGQLVGLAVGGVSGGLVVPPHGDDHEPQQHGVDDADYRVDEACYVVVLLAQLGGHQALHHCQPDHRDKHGRADRQKEEANHHGDHRRGSHSSTVTSSASGKASLLYASWKPLRPSAGAAYTSLFSMISRK